MEKTEDEDKSEIQEFFECRSVLITGAGGFVGGILLEHLLRLCPGVSEIFLLLRQRRGRNPAERREAILNSNPFWKVRKETPEVLEKVQVIPGELTKDDLGISPEDLEKLKKNVSVVFHCAASISFKRDLKYMLLNNVVGTYNVMNIAKKLPKIAAFVHTSTAYSNSHLDVIKEELCHIPFSVDHIIAGVRSGDETFMKALNKNYGKKWINAYVFSKSLAESVLAREALEIPVAIVRPSIVTHVWKGSLPGYVTSGTGLTDGIYGIITGFTIVTLLDENIVNDFVPVDIVANTLIAAAWSVAERRVSTPLVLNCISSNTVKLKMTDLYREFASRPYAFLCPNTFRTPSTLIVANSPLKFKLMSFIYHRIPAMMADIFIRLRGGKLRIQKLYDVLDGDFLSAWPFGRKEFHFKSENFENVKSLLNNKDSKIFNIDLTGYNFDYILQHSHVNDVFRFKNDDIELKLKQMALAERGAMITVIYKCLLVLLLFTMVWFFLKMILSMLM